MRRISLCACAMLLAGCAPTSESEGGDTQQAFSSFDETTFTVTVVDNVGDPLQGAAVTVESVHSSTLSDDSEVGHRVFLRGVSNSSGIVTGVVRLPTTISEVDIVVHQAGLTGPWTDTALQTELGYFAPSSRQTRTVAASIALTVTLEP